MKQLLTIAAVLLSITATAKDKCKGTTKAGQPCKSVIISKAGFCRFHDPNAVKCAKEGCKMIVKAKGEKCRFHN